MSQYFTYTQLFDWTRGILEAAGLDPVRAERIARAQTDVEAFGISTHGLNVAVACANIYNKQAQKQEDPDAEHPLNGQPVDLREAGAVTTFSGQKMLGIEAVLFARDYLRKQAAVHGIAWVSIRSTGWIGTLGFHLAELAREGFFAMGWVQMSGETAVVPHNGTQGRLGTNPLAIVIPRGEHDPVVADFSTSAVSRGQARRWASDDRKAPEPIFTDEEGTLTDEPKRFEDPDPMLPWGGPAWGFKGTTFSLWVESLTAMAGGVPALPEKKGGQNVHIMALNREALGCVGPGQEAMDEMVDYVLSSKPKPGTGGPRLPGTRGWETFHQVEERGIKLHPDQVKWYQDVGENFQVPFPTAQA
jgi:LDH2 family malate/lactate/ureidoglycolate dehydrogenase